MTVWSQGRNWCKGLSEAYGAGHRAPLAPAEAPHCPYTLRSDSDDRPVEEENQKHRRKRNQERDTLEVICRHLSMNTPETHLTLSFEMLILYLFRCIFLLVSLT